MSGNDFRGDVVLQRRYEKLYGKPEPKPASRPVAVMEREIFELVKERYASLAPEELGERERIRASNAAMRQIERALEAESRDAEKVRQDTHAAFFDTAALGRLMR